MPRVWLDDEFHSHPKVIGAGLEAAGLFARALSYCGAYLTDGFVPGEWVEIVAAKHKKAPKKLQEVGLWRPVKNGFYIPDYLDYNDSKEDVLRFREERSKSGRKGARRRWGGGKQAKPLFDEDGESFSESHDNSHSESHASSDGSGHGSRARRARDGSAMARDRAASTTTNTTPLEEQKEKSLEAERSETPRASDLPFEKHRLIVKLLSELGTDADEGTPVVVRSLAERLPEGALVKVLESVQSAKPRNRAAYAVGAMQQELAALNGTETDQERKARIDAESEAEIAAEMEATT